ncbi:fructosamine kinase family protein [Aciduricibacillus chroicocephali]|uniref:Fructosamine kinase family protein n=1 Tax=Aciduricibacillus chroicocephali TaxID=3054939 RepID=A0ABY9KWT7_9BACI|nr:fructosamine kinase family protein [Bacillaceae bacterium 44XB]
MKQLLQNGLDQLGINESIQSFKSVSGGDINEAFYVRTGNHEYFVKLNRQVSPDFFEFEKRGLEKIKATDSIAVPKVYGVKTDVQSGTPMLWLEWIEGKKAFGTDSQLGEQLAQMHMNKQSKYGFDEKSFIGRLEQKNHLSDSWLEYYRNCRLAGQLEIGRERQTITGDRERKLVKLLVCLDQWVPEKPHASLLHGDLWGGNWMVGAEGRPHLIDPSVLYGDNEFELAFTNLFGGFSDKFYEAYQSVFPLSDTYHDLEPLYQLYYLLVHLNMFGETYGGSVDRILDRYVG